MSHSLRVAEISRRLASLVCAVYLLSAPAFAQGGGASANGACSLEQAKQEYDQAMAKAPAAGCSRIQASYVALPLAFERNQGQTDAQVKYMARGNGYTLFLTANDAVFSLHSPSAESKTSTVRRGTKLRAKGLPARRNTQKDSAVVRMQLVGGNPLAKVSASGPLLGKSNYFLGNDPSKWRRDVAHYARVSYQDVYPGVNLAFHGAQRQLEFDFVMAPGASAAPISFHFTGARGVKADDSGNLVISSTAGDVLLRKPVAYQEQNGARQPVDARFALKAGNQVGFELGNYDRSRELVIDPSVSYAYSTFLGGNGNDEGQGIAFDGAGAAYVTGETASQNFPGTSGGFTGTAQVFVTKIAPNGSSFIYSTYIGGSGPKGDSGNAIAVDASGDAFVAGSTSSANFPVTPNPGAFQTALKGTTGNAFVFELSPSGTLTYSTYLGGTGHDIAFGIALDSSGAVYTVGKTTSTDFPTSPSPLQATVAGGFVTKLKPAGGGANDLLFSTYLGGGSRDFASAVAVGSGSFPNVYVTGSTSSASFPTAPVGVIQPHNGGGSSDAFVAAMNSTGRSYVYFTFLGGSDTDIGRGIAVDSSGNAYVTGQTASSNTLSAPFPLVSALQPTFGGGVYDAFVAKLNPTGTALMYSTYLGGRGLDTGASIAVDGTNNAYVTGQTDSSNFPTANATQLNLGGGTDAFVSEINSTGTPLVFSTYLGGSGVEDVGNLGAIAVDSVGANIYVTGNTASTDFPTHATSAYAEGGASGGGTDAFVVKYLLRLPGPNFGGPPVPVPSPAPATDRSLSALGGQPQLFVAGEVTNQDQALVTYRGPGGPDVIAGVVFSAEANGQKTEARADSKGHALLNIAALFGGGAGLTTATIRAFDAGGHELAHAQTKITPTAPGTSSVTAPGTSSATTPGASGVTGPPQVPTSLGLLKNGSMVTIPGKNLGSQSQLVVGNRIQETLSASSKEMTSFVDPPALGPQPAYVRNPLGTSPTQTVHCYTFTVTASQTALVRGQHALATGTYEGLPPGTEIEFTNLTPSVVKMKGRGGRCHGEHCVFTVSKSAGICELDLTGERGGNFIINYEVHAPTLMNINVD